MQPIILLLLVYSPMTIRGVPFHSAGSVTRWPSNSTFRLAGLPLLVFALALRQFCTHCLDEKIRIQNDQ